MSLLYEHARAFGLDLTEVQEERFEKYYRLLVEWNERFNLTAVTDYTAVQLKHFLDSLSAAPVIAAALRGPARLIDVGAGAGMPGLPLAVAIPELRVTLLEATGKKVRFLDEVVRELELENAKAVHGRAEEFAHQPTQRARYDFAVARALAPLRTLVEYVLPFVRVGGVAIAYKAVEAESELAEARAAIKTLGGQVREVRRVQLGPLDDVRHLIVMDKRAPTPKPYPRAAGLPRSKPL